MTSIRTISVILVMLLGGVQFSCSSQVLAFPGAEGFGRYTTGGRGGRVIAVTNLNDNGPGSLRAALDETGSRMIVFRISGTIALESDLKVDHGDVTVAGQTAPGDGICLRNYQTRVTATNVIIRFIRFRLGDETAHPEDPLTVMGSRNVIIDHCSMSWGVDESGSFYDNEDFTLQWSIISESLYNSRHPKGPHGYGGIWGGAQASFLYNLLAHHSSRNPRFNGDRTAKVSGRELVDFRNNAVYNWGFKGAYGGERGKQNVVANYFKPGPATLNKKRFLEPWDTVGKWYLAGNILEGSTTASTNNWAGVGGSHGAKGRVNVPLIDVQPLYPAESAFDAILRFAGATFPQRDPVDRRIVTEVRSGTATFGGKSYVKDHKVKSGSLVHGIIDTQQDVGGWPDLKSSPPPDDSDGDGIPDIWESAKGLDPNNQNDGRTISASGYSNLELYLNEIVAGEWLRPSAPIKE